MKRSILLAVSLLLLAPSLDATSVQCVPTQGCPKGQKPPACCKPPPCEFYHELKVARAMRHAFSLKVQAKALAIAKTDDAAGQEAYSRAFHKSMRAAHKRFAQCPPSTFYRPPPSAMVYATRQCSILGADYEAVGPDDMKANSNACNETIDADYARMKMEQIHCEADAQKTEPQTVLGRRFQDLTAYQTQVDSLEASLLRYWSACTITPNANRARLVSKAGLDALKKAQRETRAKFRAAQRAAKRT